LEEVCESSEITLKDVFRSSKTSQNEIPANPNPTTK
jgi:hypothetical protein